MDEFDGVDIWRGSSDRRRDRHGGPEMLVDATRKVQTLLASFADNGSAISTEMAAIVSKKALLLKILSNDGDTGDRCPPSVGQVGLIRGDQIALSPNNPRPAQRRAVAGSNDRPVPLPVGVGQSRFSVTPITSRHNVSSQTIGGRSFEYDECEIMAPTGHSRVIKDFHKAGESIPRGERILIRSGEHDVDPFYWHCQDVTTAGNISNHNGFFTQKDLSFEKVRSGYRFKQGQKIGIAVYRNFRLESQDVGYPALTFDDEQLKEIYGRENRVNIYTGEITRVSDDFQWFEHNLNTHKGCSGAIVFLLDEGQNTELGVIGDDHGKAIAVHGGGDRFEGKAINVAFKID